MLVRTESQALSIYLSVCLSESSCFLQKLLGQSLPTPIDFRGGVVMSLRDCLALGGKDMTFAGLVSSSQSLGLGVRKRHYSELIPSQAPNSQTVKLNRIQIVGGHAPPPQ